MSDNTLNTLKGLTDLLNRSRNAYLKYHSNNSRYKYAKKLRIINNEIFMHIEKMEVREDSELTEAIIELIEHLEQWFLLWDEKSKSKNFLDKEKFVFTGYKSYPKKLDELLISRLK